MQPQPRLAAIATAAPAHELGRDQVLALAGTLFGVEADRLATIFGNSGIDSRRSCVPLDWYRHPHGLKERSALFVQHALDLAEAATLRCLDKAGVRPDQVDAVVAVSTSGICTPSLDALLMERVGLRENVTRLPIFGLGCAGGILGLARAAALAKACPGSNVLLIVVELCGLTFRAQDRSASNMVATALFGDGCAAALLSTEIDGATMQAWGEHTWPHSLNVMGWRMEDDGFGILFSRDIPPLVQACLRPALDGWLQSLGISRKAIGRYFCHPGGAKVVTALEQALELESGTLAIERDILRRFGNMSAATLPYVLESALATPLTVPAIALALGPGFTAGFMMLTP